VSSCSAVCPLCWLPRRLVYVRHVRILDSKKKWWLGGLWQVCWYEEWTFLCCACHVMVLLAAQQALGS
jgi:hypothetical protein